MYRQVYYDPSRPGSYGGVKALWKAVGGKKKDVEEWLKTQDTYTLHRPSRKRYKHNQIQVAGINDQFEADLVDLQGLAKSNNNYKYLLTVIDALSKYAWAIPLKDKTGSSVLQGFKDIFKDRKPRKLRTDAGKEFLNAQVQNYLKKEGVIFFTSKSDTKCAMVERFNRTLKSRMWRYFTATRQERYLDVLQHLVDSYNNTTHTTTGSKPVEVTPYNAEKVWRRMYGNPKKRKLPKLKVNSMVRIVKEKNVFAKGYRPNWTSEIFKIKRVKRTKEPSYTLMDLNGEDILGSFLEAELQAASKEETQTYKVRKVLRHRGKGRSKESLVLWEGFPDKYKRWIPYHDLAKYQ